MLVEDAVAGQSKSSSVSACKHQDDVAWTNVALAVRVAQEIGLHDDTTYTLAASTSWQMRRRINVWIRELQSGLS